MITYVQQFVAYLPPIHVLIVDFDNVDIVGYQAIKTKTRTSGYMGMLQHVQIVVV